MSYVRFKEEPANFCTGEVTQIGHGGKALVHWDDGGVCWCDPEYLELVDLETRETVQVIKKGLKSRKFG